MIADALAALAAVGGLSGVAAVVTSMTAARRQAKDINEGLGIVRSEVTPNHGSSMHDAVRRIEDGQRDVVSMVLALDHRLGHELGEMRRSTEREHEDYDVRLRSLEETVHRP